MANKTKAKGKQKWRPPYKGLVVTRLGDGLDTYSCVWSNGLSITVVIRYKRFPIIAHTVGDYYS